MKKSIEDFRRHAKEKALDTKELWVFVKYAQKWWTHPVVQYQFLWLCDGEGKQVQFLHYRDEADAAEALELCRRLKRGSLLDELLGARP